MSEQNPRLECPFKGRYSTVPPRFLQGPITTALNLGPLASLAGSWKGTGFNSIWRPDNHFAEAGPTFIKRFLLMVPEIAPRTEFGFHPVASDISTILASSGRLSTAIIMRSLLMRVRWSTSLSMLASRAFASPAFSAPFVLDFGIWPSGWRDTCRTTGGPMWHAPRGSTTAQP